MADREQCCCFTGHRPQKLPWGMNENDPRCVKLKNELDARLGAIDSRALEDTVRQNYENNVDFVFMSLYLREFDEEGKMVSVGKEKGRVKAMERLIKYVEELGEDVKDHRVIIGNADCREIAEELERMLKERFGDDLRTEIADVNPTAGSHCGPNTAGICFHAKRRTL